VADSVGVLFFLDIQLLVLGGRQVPECFVQPVTVVEADPVEDIVFAVLEGREAASVDELDLKARDPGFGHRDIGAAGVARKPKARTSESIGHLRDRVVDELVVTSRLDVARGGFCVGPAKEGRDRIAAHGLIMHAPRCRPVAREAQPFTAPCSPCAITGVYRWMDSRCFCPSSFWIWRLERLHPNWRLMRGFRKHS
jgi:hypothetical protein